MKTWIVRYTQIPTNYHQEETALVEARTADEAGKLVGRRLGEHLRSLRKYAITVVEYQEPEPIEGEILTMHHNEHGG